MAASGDPYPRTVEDIFEDFKARRAGLLRALTDGKSAVARSGGDSGRLRARARQQRED